MDSILNLTSRRNDGYSSLSLKERKNILDRHMALLQKSFPRQANMINQDGHSKRSGPKVTVNRTFSKIVWMPDSVNKIKRIKNLASPLIGLAERINEAF